MNKNILALVFLIASALLATTAVTTTMVPAAYAGGDHDGGDGNKAKAGDDSVTQIFDCDENEQEATDEFPAICA